MNMTVRALFAACGLCAVAACASTSATGDREPPPPAPLPAPSTSPLAKRDVHAQCDSVPRPPTTDLYNASRAPVLSKVMFYARENYFEPRRLQWNRALLGALTALPHVAPEISIDATADALPAAIRVVVNGHACRVPIAAVSEPWEMRSFYIEVIKLVQASLPPLPAELSGRRLLALEVAAANGMLFTFDAKSLLMDATPRSGGSRAPSAPETVFAGPRKVGYLRLSRLVADAAKRTSEALRHFERESVGGIILDLRGNTGGLFDQAGKVVDAFAKRGIVVTLVARAGRAVIEARDDGTEPKVPVVVLVDGQTGAGGAIVAAGLQSLGGAILLGAVTNADTSIQVLYDIYSPPDVLPQAPLILKLTTGEWRLNGDQSIEGKGVTPDVEIDPRVLALESSDGAPESSPAVVAAREALANAATPAREAVIAAARAAVKAAELKALPGVKI
jgi:Peptidase family S41